MITFTLAEALEWLEALSTGKAWAFVQPVENERAYARALLAGVKSGRF